MVGSVVIGRRDEDDKKGVVDKHRMYDMVENRKEGLSHGVEVDGKGNE